MGRHAIIFLACFHHGFVENVVYTQGASRLETVKTHDRISGLFWLGVSIFACFKSLQVEVGTIRSPGPGFLPFWAGVIVAILSLLLLAKSFVRSDVQDSPVPLLHGTGWTRILLFLVILCLWAILLQRIGYLVSTFGLMLSLLSLSERMRWWRRILGSILISSATYILFNIWLGVQLPAGILG